MTIEACINHWYDDWSDPEEHRQQDLIELSILRMKAALLDKIAKASDGRDPFEVMSGEQRTLIAYAIEMCSNIPTPPSNAIVDEQPKKPRICESLDEALDHLKEINGDYYPADLGTVREALARLADGLREQLTQKDNSLTPKTGM